MHFKKIIPVTLTLALLAAISGCAKKPRRPNPIDTIMGSGGSAYGTAGSDQINPTAFGDGGFADASEAIASRGSNGAGGNPMDTAERGVLAESDVYFDFDSASIKPSERAKLADAADYLRLNSRAKIVLEGHCDWRGTSEYNLALGDRRAKSVQRYLETLGVSPDRITTLSKGDLNATKGASEAQMGRERKTEILVSR
ncbi:OmpA family protein [Puniceicoccaceae bacterium K14]|nr:OmpA family protein [Puniceicoccaceae bacterium K14]